jgi:antirestriction protein ArdC
MNTEKQDVYARITNKVIADLEKGVRPWLKPWNAALGDGCISRPLRHNGLPYSGINILMLWASAIEHGFAAPMWMTFKQALELNAHVRKGEKGSLVVYANSIIKTETGDGGEEIEREIPFMKGYTVFNVDQIEDLPESYYSRPEIRLTPVDRSARADSFFRNTGADIRYRGGHAFYAYEGTTFRCP